MPKTTYLISVDEYEPGIVQITTDALDRILVEAGWKFQDSQPHGRCYERQVEIPDKPSEGARRCMIYKHVRRLEDGCDTCSKSAMFCAANLDMNGHHCCTTCSH